MSIQGLVIHMLVVIQPARLLATTQKDMTSL